jgi:hypothetical protein
MRLSLQTTAHLRSITYSQLPNLFIAPNIQRIINNYWRDNIRNVYEDGQNVHNSSIQECIRKSIHNIISIPPIVSNIRETIQNDPILSDQVKHHILEYCNDPEAHSTLNITFEELLMHVFSRIVENLDAIEIKQILNSEIMDSVGKCYTGRMSRLINCLAGFDPLVYIQIADNDQIAHIIELVRMRLSEKNEYTVEKHKEIVIQELIERGFEQSVIDEWTQYIE